MAVSVTQARGELRNLLAVCRSVEARQKPPFDLDLGKARAAVEALFPEWREVDDLRLDATVVNALTRVLQIQEARLRYEAGLFLADPQLLAEKLATLREEALASAFLASWHPVVELEQVTARGLEAAKAYFDALLPWRDRLYREPAGRPPEPARWSEEELTAMGVVRREGFLGFLGEMWEELRASGTVEYWAFVRRGDPVRRAYGVAFLVSYGYAELEERDESLALRANAARVSRQGARSTVVVVEGSS